MLYVREGNETKVAITARDCDSDGHLTATATR